MPLSKIEQSSVNSGVAGTGPAFRVTLSANQTVTAANTKVAFNVKTFDTAGAFNNTGSTVTLNGLSVPAYSFMPPVAGYYQVNGVIGTTSLSSFLFSFIYLNGSAYISGSRTDTPSAANGYGSVVTDLIYLNGTTDYISLYGYASGLSFGSGTSTDACKFSAFLARAA